MILNRLNRQILSAGLTDSAACPVVEAQRECLRGLKRKRFQ